MFKKSFLIVCMALIGLCSPMSQAKLLVYEPFDYAPSDTGLGELNGGVGFSEAWVVHETTNKEFFNPTAEGLTWGALPVTGNKLERISTGSTESLYRSLSATLPSGGFWFSCLMSLDSNTGLAVATDPFPGDKSSPGTILDGGQAVGFQNRGNALGAAVWINGNDELDAGVDGPEEVHMIVGQVILGASSTTVTLYTMKPDLISLTEISSMTQGSAISASELDMLIIHSNRGPEIDEIRIGETLEDVIGMDSDISATKPGPADGAEDVIRDDAVLTWTPGNRAAEHRVFFGTDFDEVSAAGEGDPAHVATQTEATYALEPLTLDQTYYWRVDEVNAIDPESPWPGKVWRFSAEPTAVVLDPDLVTVTVSSTDDPAVDPNVTINGAGLDVNGYHGVDRDTMWLSSDDDPQPWIEYQADSLFKLHGLKVWNHNTDSEAELGRGIKEAQIEYLDVNDVWQEAHASYTFNQASGGRVYAANTEVSCNDVLARAVRITALESWTAFPDIFKQTGLSEVQIMILPVWPREPEPVSDAADVSSAPLLTWRAGRGAAQHQVYLGTSPDALSLAGTVEENVFDTGDADLMLGQTYYWQVQEVNDTEVWSGLLWEFTVETVTTVDNMETYSNEDGLQIWAAWTDGFDNQQTNGALVGTQPAFNDYSPETEIVYAGSQSLPIHYNNSTAPRSEATRVFDPPLSFSGHGIQGLVLYVHGSALNTGGTLYVKVNDVRMPYDGGVGLNKAVWRKWYIPADDVTGTDLGSVSSLTVGIDNGGQGVFYVDDIQLVAEPRNLVTPEAPDTENLLAHYAFEGNTLDETGRYPATNVNGGIFESGPIGQAITLDGIFSYVTVDNFKGIDAVDGTQQPFTLSCWFTTTGNGELITWGSDETDPEGGQRLSLRIDAGRLRTEHGDGNLIGTIEVSNGEWHHAALRVNEGAPIQYPDTILSVDGMTDVDPATGSDVVFNILADLDVSLGRRATHDDRYFPGSIDEVRFYDRVLSDGEVAALAGLTDPFDD